MIAPDQPPPKPSAGDAWQELIDSGLLPDTLHPAAAERRQIGIERYGQPLQRGDGRNHLVDALQEALDLVVYLYAARAPEPVLMAAIELARQVAALPGCS